MARPNVFMEEMMVERVPLSKTGHQKLRDELERLERVERPETVKAIEVARGHGDLSENAEYHAAKDRQGMIEGRIRDLKDKLARAEVIDCAAIGTERIIFGAVVRLLDLSNDEEVTYQLLGSDESDVKSGSISVLSPLGRSMLGKEVGDEIKVQTPGGLREFEIVDIQASSFS